MLSVAARTLERRTAAPAARLLHTRTACLVSEKDGTGAGGAAKVIVTPAATATIITPNTQPNTHYTSSIHTPAHPTPAPTPTQPTTPPTTPPPPPPPQPTQQKPVVIAATPSTPPPPHTSSYESSYSRPRGSSIRSRITSFLVGVGVAAGVGYYRLQSDVWSSARALEGQIEGLRTAGSGADSRGMAEQVAALERRVAAMEKEKGKK